MEGSELDYEVSGIYALEDGVLWTGGFRDSWVDGGVTRATKSEMDCFGPLAT